MNDTAQPHNAEKPARHNGGSLTIAEDMTLLLLDDDSGRLLANRSIADLAVAGCLLAELTLRGSISLTESVRRREGKLVIHDSEPPGDELLDSALRQLSAVEGKPASRALSALAKGASDASIDRLVQRGLIKRKQAKLLRIIPTTLWPAADPRHESQIRTRIERVLDANAEPDAATGTLISLLSTTNLLKKVFPTSNRELARTRASVAKQIDGGTWADDALKRSLQMLHAAVVAATVAASAAASS